MNLVLDREQLVAFLEAKNFKGAMDLIREAEREQVEEGLHHHIFLNGIVSHRTNLPLVQIDVNGRMVLIDVAQARQVASDIYLAASRAEADAVILKFLEDPDLSPEQNLQKSGQAMVMFRNFRAELDEKADSERI